MRKISFITDPLIALVFLLATMALFPLDIRSQTPEPATLPLAETRLEPVFGNDVTLDPRENQNQRPVSVCSAFNGWLYAAFLYDTVLTDRTRLVPIIEIVVRRSTDNGNTWSDFCRDWWDVSNLTHLATIKIVTTGHSLDNLKLIISWVMVQNSYATGYGSIQRWNGVTGAFEKEIYGQSNCYDVAIASDVSGQPFNTTSNSLGIIFSEFNGPANHDSLFFVSSTDGGKTLEPFYFVAATGNKFHKISLSYGRSLSYPTGNYFAAWEEQVEVGETPGRIFTARTFPDANSPMTVPFRIDMLDPADSNQCRNPVVACQNSEYDNDSANLTEMILFEKWDQQYQRYGVKGYYNLQAMNQTVFHPVALGDPAHNNFQPDVLFNSFDSTFAVTWFDSTTRKLPLLKNEYNLRNASQWNTVSQGYNDNESLTDPSPKLGLNNQLHSEMAVWSYDSNTGKGVAVFDAVPHFWVDVPDRTVGQNLPLVKVYPNPCSEHIFFHFQDNNKERLHIDILDLFGNVLKSGDYSLLSPAGQIVEVPIRDIPKGFYVYRIRTDHIFTSGLIHVLNR